jgi:hypothetical protein
MVGVVFLAIEIQQNTNSLELNRQIALADAYATRNNTVQDSHTQAALSPDFADLFVKWRRGGNAALTEAELFRVTSWETARLFRIESQYIMWEQGLLKQEFIDNLREITQRSVGGWLDLDLTWIAHGGFREEIEIALQQLDQAPQN